MCDGCSSKGGSCSQCEGNCYPIKKLRGFEAVEKDKQYFPDIPTCLPTRATAYSAGYDFYAKETITIPAGKFVMFATDVKASMAGDEVLFLFIRSSLGTKRNLMLMNNVGVVDSDYYSNPDNDGNIMCALYNFGEIDQHINAGEKVMQGVFTQYFTTVDDDSNTTRRLGGLGSTGK